MNLKSVLNLLQQKLVSEHRFEDTPLMGREHLSRSTHPIQMFMTWLESQPEVLQVLKKMGVE
jgi:hypothetical protein